MNINTEYLKKFIEFNSDYQNLDKLLPAIGIEIDDETRHKGDQVLTVEITPNRPDWLSHYGIAREIHAKLPDSKLKPVEFDVPAAPVPGQQFLIEIEQSNDCGRYSGCIIKDIEVKESSQQIKDLIESMGLRPINNIVDVSNLVLMTLGHPIHIFDLDTISGDKVIIRRGAAGEKLVLLDKTEIRLDASFLVIADAMKPIALAGIMGGENSGVTESTRSIFIESAYFNPVLIRRSARRTGLKTDASYRFERGMDIQNTMDVMFYTLKLINESQDKKLNITFLKDEFPNPPEQIQIEMSKDYPSVYSGMTINSSQCEQVLGNLGFRIQDKGDQWLVKVPSHRVDCFEKQDLVEEIVRIVGYENLNSEIPLSLNRELQQNPERRILKAFRDFFTNNGFFEVKNYSFNSEKDNQQFDPKNQSVVLKNPIGLDYSVMRNSLFPGLLKNCSLNYNNGEKRISLFELGRIFSSLGGDRLTETSCAGFIGSGAYRSRDWRITSEESFDYYVLKSILAALFDKLDLDLYLHPGEKPFFKQSCSFRILVNGTEVGVIGELDTHVLEYYKITKPVFAAELYLSVLVKLQQDTKFQAWNRFPISKRDFSFFMSRNLKYQDLEKMINRIKPPTLIGYELSDLYEGKDLPGGVTGLSMSFTYQGASSTLTNEEVNQIHQDLLKKLISELDLVQR